MNLRAPAMLLLLAATPCRADCHIDQFKFYHGSEAPATMHAGSGAPCLMKFTNGRKSNIDSIAITKQASHGAGRTNFHLISRGPVRAAPVPQVYESR
jgi:hypothetical protein